mgnify:CR=1 FL=1
MNTQIITDLKIEIGTELSEFAESGHDEISDWCHEQADSSADVIYYSKAEALYNGASMEERDEAESMIEDCGGFGEGKTMADRFTLLAYWITYNQLSADIREQAEAAEEAVREKIDQLEEIEAAFSDIQ